MNIKNAVATLRTHARSLILGGLLALTAVGIPTVSAFAQPISGGTTTATCSYGGVDYKEGDWITTAGGNVYRCGSNGFWQLIARAR